jgi:hypothetical protein
LFGLKYWGVGVAKDEKKLPLQKKNIQSEKNRDPQWFGSLNPDPY